MEAFLTQIYEIKNANKKALAVLIDPDHDSSSVEYIAQICQSEKVDFVFVGGSLVSSGVMHTTINTIKRNFLGPVYIFPGNEFMVDESADGILFLSLLSGRNPEYLIGKQVVAAPMLAQTKLDVVSTAYLLVDGGKESSVSYISNTKPIPSDKPDIAIATAMAGRLMGMQCIYMDAGSGALHPIPADMISRVKKQVSLPLIVGGGIKTSEQAFTAFKHGADVLVIGNGVEQNEGLITKIAEVKLKFGKTVEV